MVTPYEAPAANVMSDGNHGDVAFFLVVVLVLLLEDSIVCRLRFCSMGAVFVGISGWIQTIRRMVFY